MPRAAVEDAGRRPWSGSLPRWSGSSRRRTGRWRRCRPRARRRCRTRRARRWPRPGRRSPRFSMNRSGEDHEDAGDDADRSRPPTAATNAHGAVIATRPASMPLTIMPGIGLARLPCTCITNIAGDGTEGAGDGGVRGDHVRTGRRCGERRRGVEAEPAEQQDERAEHGHRDVVAGKRVRRAVLVVLADAGTEDDRPGQAGDTTHGVHDAGAGEVDVAERPRSVLPSSARASRRPRSRPRTAGSRWRRRTGPNRRTPSTSSARPSHRSGSWPTVSMNATM